MKYFADTFYLIALANPNDQFHARAVAWTLGFQGQIVTTSWVIAEFADAMASYRNRARCIAMLGDLRTSTQSKVYPPEPTLFEDGLNLYGARLDKDWSLTDCISFVVMEREGIHEELTGDHHFEQAGFVALLK